MAPSQANQARAAVIQPQQDRAPYGTIPGDGRTGREAPVCSRAFRLFVVTALALQAALLAWGALRHSPINTEALALPSGLGHWVLGRDALYRTTPPLVHSVAAIPSLFFQPKLDWSAYRSGPGAHAEGAVAEAFIARNGPSVFCLFTYGRWACIPLVLLGGYICARWARELYGEAAGLIALTLWAFSPDVLGYGQFIIPDIAAGAVAAAAVYTFCGWLRARCAVNALLVGVVLGFAQSTKYLLLALYPLLALLWITSYWPNRIDSTRKVFAREAPQFFMLVLASVVVVNLVYGFSGTGRKLGTYTFVSSFLRGSSERSPALVTGGNRFRGGLLGDVPLPLPEDYVMGIDTQLHDAEQGAVCYLRGQWRTDSPWYYHLYALAIKVPLGTWCLAALALGCSVVQTCPAKRRADELALVLSAVGFLVLVSAQPVLTNHVRYAFVVLPFLFVWIAKVAVLLSGPAMRAIVLACLAWTLASSLFIYPHCMSYFNELAGGPSLGHRHLLGSNLSISQDLFYLKKWADAHPDARPLKLVFYGFGQGQLLGIDYAVPAVSAGRFPLHELASRSWYGIDVNSVLGDRHALSSNLGIAYTVPLKEEGDYRYFQRLTPVDRVGYSIWIYHPSTAGADQTAKAVGTMGTSNAPPGIFPVAH